MRWGGAEPGAEPSEARGGIFLMRQKMCVRCIRAVAGDFTASRTLIRPLDPHAQTHALTTHAMEDKFRSIPPYTTAAAAPAYGTVPVVHAPPPGFVQPATPAGYPLPPTIAGIRDPTHLPTPHQYKHAYKHNNKSYKKAYKANKKAHKKAYKAQKKAYKHAYKH